MKKILAFLLFCQALVGINSTWKEADLQGDEREDEALIGIGADGPGSGGGEEEGEEEKAIKDIVAALQHIVIPTVENATFLTEMRERKNAEGLVNMLKKETKDRPIKKAIGMIVMKEHIFCGNIKYGFLQKAKETGLLHLVRQMLARDGVVNGEEILGKVLAATEDDYGGMLDELVDEFKGENELPPPLQALVVLKKLLMSSVCGNPVEALLKKAGKMIYKAPGSGLKDPFAGLEEKVLPFLQRCRRAPSLVDGSAPLTLKRRFFNLIFKQRFPCGDVFAIKSNVATIMEGKKVKRKMDYLKGSFFKRINETVVKIIDLMKKGEKLKAEELSGDQSLEILRDSLLMGFMVRHKLSQNQGPPGKPPRDAPLPKVLLHDPKMANVPGRMK